MESTILITKAAERLKVKPQAVNYMVKRARVAFPNRFKVTKLKVGDPPRWRSYISLLDFQTIEEYHKLRHGK